MNTRRVLLTALLCACFAMLLLPGCTKESEGLAPVAPEDTLSIRPSDKGVEEFLALLGDAAPSMYEDDACYNITPGYIADNAEYAIFKFDQSCASFLLYDGAAYPLGEYLGGTGADSFALADMNGDREYELYFTFSWGSGFHRSQIGCFDPTTAGVTIFDAAFFSEDCMIALSGDGGLAVRHADISYGAEGLPFYVSFDLAAGDTLGIFVYGDGVVQFSEVEETSAS
ncbi:MAG TPA: hypothetical protein VN540_03095 [Clostridia bacterium]|nr:hypothetical protein [Clostridia bacterium]